MARIITKKFDFDQTVIMVESTEKNKLGCNKNISKNDTDLIIDENINVITIIKNENKDTIVLSDYIYSGLFKLGEIRIENDENDDNVKRLVIGKKAFFGCSVFNTFNIPNSLETLIIDDYAFEYSYYVFYNYFINNKIDKPLPNLKYLKLGKGIFNNNENLKDIIRFKLPEKLETLVLDNYTFENCEYLTDFVLNDNLKNLTIGNQTFAGCNKLSKIKLPKNTKIITLLDDKCNSYFINNKIKILDYNEEKGIFSNILHFFIDLISFFRTKLFYK